MNRTKDGFKNPFGFTVAHAMRKNFAFPLAVFVMSLALYLRSFFGSDKIRQLTALKSGGSATLELLRESGKFLIIADGNGSAVSDIFDFWFYFYTAVLVCRGEFREAGGKNAETVSVAEMYTYKNIGV